MLLAKGLHLAKYVVITLTFHLIAGAFCLASPANSTDTASTVESRAKFELLGLLGADRPQPNSGRIVTFFKNETELAVYFEPLLARFCEQEGIAPNYTKETEEYGITYSSRAIAAALSLNYDFYEGVLNNDIFIEATDENLLRYIKGVYRGYAGPENANVIIMPIGFKTLKQVGLILAQLKCPSVKIFSNNPTSESILTTHILLFTPTEIIARKLGIKKKVSIFDQEYFGLPIYDGTQFSAFVIEADLSPNRTSFIDQYEADKHLSEIAFLMGIMGKGYIGYKSVFGPNESEAKKVYYHHAFDLAKKFGLTAAATMSESSVSDWEPPLLVILKQFVIDGIFPRPDLPDWDTIYAKSFLTGSYCRYGLGREIGFVATPRAEFMIELMQLLHQPYRITHLERDRAPGGSSVTFTEETIFGTPISDQIIEEAAQRIRLLKKQP